MSDELLDTASRIEHYQGPAPGAQQLASGINYLLQRDSQVRPGGYSETEVAEQGEELAKVVILSL